MEDETTAPEVPYKSIHEAAAEAEPEPGEPEEFETDVDGQPARIRRGLSLVPAATTDDSSVLQSLALAYEAEARAHTAAKKAHNAFKEAKAKTEAAVSVAANHYSQSRNLQMELTVPREGGEPE